MNNKKYVYIVFKDDSYGGSFVRCYSSKQAAVDEILWLNSAAKEFGRDEKYICSKHEIYDK